jgi:hypothetical protein
MSRLRAFISKTSSTPMRHWKNSNSIERINYPR